jgi:hypothetical protein
MNRTEKLLLRDALIDEEFNSDLERITDDVKAKIYTHEQRNDYLVFAYYGYLLGKNEYNPKNYE